MQDADHAHAPSRRANDAPDVVVGDLYGELVRLARRRMSSEPAGHTLQPTALVHEVWLRLSSSSEPVWSDRAHFLRAAAVAMRQILADRARRQRRLKRAGSRRRVPLSQVALAQARKPIDVEALDEALARLEAHDKRKADVVALLYLSGCTIEETAAALATSPATVKRDWAFARAWLGREVAKE